MRRYPLVIGGTVAGTAAVLAFPTHQAHLTLPSAAGVTVAPTTDAPTTTAPAAGPSTSTPGATTAPSATPTTSAAAPSTTAPSATRSATSADQQFNYGDIAVKVTVTGTKITGVAITQLNETDGRSVSIDRYAVPQLESQVLAAGSVNIDGVSGATFTSQAFVDAVANALGKLGIST